MTAMITNLFRLGDPEDAGRMTNLAEADLAALRAAGDWIETFVAKPHGDLGRAGSVCPFVPRALERKTLWLAPERIAGGSVADVVQLVCGYRKLFLAAPPVDGEDAIYKSFVIVFSDLSGNHAENLFRDVLQHHAAPAYEQDGLVLGGFYPRNEGAAIYNPGFGPFRSPTPFLLMRRGVFTDWKFFLDKADWLDRWARRYEGADIRAPAEELRSQSLCATRD